MKRSTFLVRSTATPEVNGIYASAQLRVPQFWNVNKWDEKAKKRKIFKIIGGFDLASAGFGDEYARAWAICRQTEEEFKDSDLNWETRKPVVYFAAPMGKSVEPPTKGWINVGGVGDVTVTCSGKDKEQFKGELSKQIAELKDACKNCKDKKEKKRLGSTLDQLIESMDWATFAEDRAPRLAAKIHREGVDLNAKRNFVYALSADIHGGVAGLYDYGPHGASLKTNLLAEWRKHFIIAEDMLEVESAVLTPHPVLKTSGHVDKFSDFMVKDLETGDCYRADKLLEEHIEDLLDTIPPEQIEERNKHKAVFSQADAFSQKQLGEQIKAYGIKSKLGNDLSDPYPFNLMFGTQIGPTGKVQGYLRPETAQGIFVNFAKLLQYNNGRMPFAAAQIGLAFRNEISPRQGLIRVREFQQCEIEHFCKGGKEEKHPKFNEVTDKVMTLLDRSRQTGEDIPVEMPIGKAVAQGLISTETLGYYMTRTCMFLEKIGITPNKIRFRQHKADEMAHYANDCWDAEIHTTQGWVECVGHADRSCFDLTNHAKDTKTRLEAEEVFDKPRPMVRITKKPNKKEIGMAVKKTGNKKLSKFVFEYINDLSQDDALALYEELQEKGSATIKDCQGNSFELTKSMFTIKKENIMSKSRAYTPSVVEPSFGIGRILYSLLEHSLWERPDQPTRVVMSFRPRIAPIKVALLPLSRDAGMEKAAHAIHRSMTDEAITSRLDDSSGAVGRRYVRADEAGIPFAVTIDFQTLKDNSVTIRERDSKQQLRVPGSEIRDLLIALANERISWQDAADKYPAMTVQEL